MILKSLQGKVALVTGAASGIGEATAKELAEAGVKMVLLDVDEEGVYRAAKQFPNAVAVHGDIAQKGTADRAVAAAITHFGRLDVGLNIAGISGRRPIVEMEDDEWQRMIDVNLYGTFALCRAEARVMIPQHYGVIVNCSSVRAFSGVLNGTHYTASKAGINGLSYALQIELQPHGIRVNCVAPGGTATNLFRNSGQPQAPREGPRQNRGFTADQVGRLFAFLASDDSDVLEGQVLGSVRYNGMNTGVSVS
ncbi:MAG TPA: SDR family NAD(P)-dependent oxidoreductase [Chloroflexota bacterium]|jgi:NAD(P)-dependent dehydrogenase (short-subunit alcohol dehydrogenase family)|nr:SDR family NAD(P)-dependent oxidoreductase [Chloroflexota bacterium]